MQRQAVQRKSRYASDDQPAHELVHQRRALKEDQDRQAPCERARAPEPAIALDEVLLRARVAVSIVPRVELLAPDTAAGRDEPDAEPDDELPCRHVPPA